MRSLLLTALLALAVLGVLRAQGPDTLTAGDLMVAGVPDGADSGVIRRLLGTPEDPKISPGEPSESPSTDIPETA